MADKDDGLSSDDLIRQAKEQFDDTEVDSSDSVIDRFASDDRFTEPDSRFLPPTAPPEPVAEPEPLLDDDREFFEAQTDPPYASQSPIEDDHERINPGDIFVAGSAEDGGGDDNGSAPVETIKPKRDIPWGVILGVGILAFFFIGNFLDSSKNAADLDVGDCFLSPDANEFFEVEVVGCDEPHDYEIFAVAALTGTAYPGDDELFGQAFQVCEPFFEPYVGVEFSASAWFIDTFVPNREGWNDGQRTTRCAIFEADEGFNPVRTSISARDSGI